MNRIGTTGACEVVHDLREAKDGVVEAVVEAVDEDQHLPLGSRSQGTVKPGERLVAVDHVGLERHELRGRIARHLSRPLHLADLPRARRRDRDGDVGEGRGWSAVAREHLRRIGPLARGGDEHVDLARAGRRSAAHGHHHAAEAGAGTKSRHQGQHQRQAQGTNPEGLSRF